MSDFWVRFWVLQPLSLASTALPCYNNYQPKTSTSELTAGTHALLSLWVGVLGTAKSIHQGAESQA
jgi:hypothetical protein